MNISTFKHTIITSFLHIFTYVKMETSAVTSRVCEQDIYDAVSRCHNPGLIHPEESPNSNTIYHIYNDGEITDQKGGWAYQQRTMRPTWYGLCRSFDATKFPLKSGDQNQYGYAIVTYADAVMIRTMMEKLIKQ